MSDCGDEEYSDAGVEMHPHNDGGGGDENTLTSHSNSQTMTLPSDKNDVLRLHTLPLESVKPSNSVGFDCILKLFFSSSPAPLPLECTSLSASNKNTNFMTPMMIQVPNSWTPSMRLSNARLGVSNCLAFRLPIMRSSEI
jgi:hypothetical protein